jgi:hypothetical protein
MGDVQGPEKVNDTCVKTVHVGMMDREVLLYQIGIDSLNSIVTLTPYVSIEVACCSTYTDYLNLQ